MKNVNEVRP